MGEGLAEFIIKQRVQYMNKVMEELNTLINEENYSLISIYRRLMNVSKEVEDKREVISCFLSEAKNREYYKEIIEKVDNITFESLRKAGVFSVDLYNSDNIMYTLASFSSYVDDYLIGIAEPLKSMPWYFEEKDTRNCLGDCLVISTIIEAKGNAKDAKLLEVCETKRVDHLIRAKKMIENGDDIVVIYDNNGFEEEKKKLLEQKEEIEKIEREYRGILSSFPSLDDKIIGIDVDIFHGYHMKEKLLESIESTIEYIKRRTHGIIKIGEEYLDFPLEYKNIKKSNEYDLKEGLFLNTYVSTLILLSSLSVENLRRNYNVYDSITLLRKIHEEVNALYEVETYRKNMMLNSLKAYFDEIMG